MLRKILARMALLAVTVCLTITAAFAQGDEPRYSLRCNDQDASNDTRGRHCEVKEQTLAPSGTLKVDASPNGGISVKAWERNEILLRYRIQTHAATQEEAKLLASQIRVATAGGQIRAEGPETTGRANWDVSYEIFAPVQSDLSLSTHNGGISINGIRGRINFEAENGGVSLKRLGGNVSGRTVNGGLSVELSGSRWEGEGLNVRTTNGGLSISIPDNYSARLEAGTINGGFKASPSIADVTRETKRVALDLGSGGSSLKIHTTNGGVSIKRLDSY